MKHLRSLITALALSTVIITISLLSIIFDTRFFDQQFAKLWSYERQPTALTEAKHLMRYRTNTDTYIDRKVYTQDEIRHLYDVKQLIHKTVFATVWALIALGAIVFIMRYLWAYPDFWKTSITRGISLFGVVVWWCMVIALLSFDRIFEQFHYLFFVDNRQFPGTSFLIESYPEDFFANAAIQRTLRATILRLLSYVWVFRIYKHLRNTTNPRTRHTSTL